MKLIDLLEAIGEGYCSFDTAEIIQICEPNMDWDNFSEFHVGSQLLKPFVDFEVDCIGAIAENVIRVALYNEDFCGVKGYFPMPCKVGTRYMKSLRKRCRNAISISASTRCRMFRQEALNMLTIGPHVTTEICFLRRERQKRNWREGRRDKDGCS